MAATLARSTEDTCSRRKSTDPAALNFSESSGIFTATCFVFFPRSEFGFLHDVFERFVIEDWKGLIRGQHRYFSAAVRRNSHWVTADEAEKIARTGRRTGSWILSIRVNLTPYS